MSFHSFYLKSLLVYFWKLITDQYYLYKDDDDIGNLLQNNVLKHWTLIIAIILFYFAVTKKIDFIPLIKEIN